MTRTRSETGRFTHSGALPDLRILGVMFVACDLLSFGPSLARAQPARPNVLIIITDDQGFGDLGVHGNPRIRTPALDRFARESVWLKSFRVSPVCSPTRASLLTGRYNFRTGVVDTFAG